MKTRLCLIIFFIISAFSHYGQSGFSNDIIINKTFHLFADSLSKLEEYQFVDTFYFKDPSYKSKQSVVSCRLVIEPQTFDTVFYGLVFKFSSEPFYYTAKKRGLKEYYFIDYEIASVYMDSISVIYKVGRIQFKNRLFRKDIALSDYFQKYYQYTVYSEHHLNEVLNLKGRKSD